jgi:hypothetical protein
MSHYRWKGLCEGQALKDSEEATQEKIFTLFLAVVQGWDAINHERLRGSRIRWEEEQGHSRVLVATFLDRAMYVQYYKSNLESQESGGGLVETSRIRRAIQSPFSLFLSDGFDRTNLGARSAIRAFFFVDHVGFPFLNSLNRTFFSTGSASHAFFANDISHFSHLFLWNITPFLV